jgi:hypothetical protein
MTVGIDSVERVLKGLDELRTRYTQEQVAPAGTLVDIVPRVLDALNSFTDIVRYLNTRRSSGAVLDLVNEAAVQDTLYLMLRPWILDLVPESPTDKVANRFAIKDFVSHSGRFVIEAKFVRNEDHGKALAREINDDIETYRYHPSCDDLIFFIYDPEGYIPDAAALERHVRTSRTYDGRQLRCYGVIKP